MKKKKKTEKSQEAYLRYHENTLFEPFALPMFLINSFSSLRLHKQVSNHESSPLTLSFLTKRNLLFNFVIVIVTLSDEEVNLKKKVSRNRKSRCSGQIA